jgi:hypothetical protein
MPVFEKKLFRAKQWNKMGDLPSFARPMDGKDLEVFETAEGVTIREKRRLIHVAPGDYVCERPDAGAIYACKKDVFEACNMMVRDEAALQSEKDHDLSALSLFYQAMCWRLAEKRAEGRSGWHDEGQCSTQYLRELLMESVKKGNMVDIANFAMMVYCRENF